MPITITVSPYDQHLPYVVRNGIIWRFNSDENLDQLLQTLIGNTITYLYIMLDEPVHPRPRMPSLEIFNTGHLTHLEIHNMDVPNTIHIPSSVNHFVLDGTTISDLLQPRINWANIKSLTLKYNAQLNDKPLIIPTDEIDNVGIYFQRFPIIRLPISTQCVMLMMTQYMQITGGLPEKEFINMGTGRDETNSIYNFKSARSKLIKRNGEYRGLEGIKQVHMETMRHVKKKNDQVNHNLCHEFINIPRRIKNAYEHRDEPIVAALHLASNVPRRMAEFVMEFTTMCF